METRKGKFCLYNVLATLSVLMMFFHLHQPTSQFEVSAENGQCSDPMLEMRSEIIDEELSTESSRRILQPIKYISPGILRADQAICGKDARGNSYSKSCLPPSSNGYSRGCSRIYKCRSD